MVRSTPALAALEEEFARATYDQRSLPEALARFDALWAAARAVRPDLGDDWEADLDADLAVARAVNGLPPRA